MEETALRRRGMDSRTGRDDPGRGLLRGIRRPGLSARWRVASTRSHARRTVERRGRSEKGTRYDTGRSVNLPPSSEVSGTKGAPVSILHGVTAPPVIPRFDFLKELVVLGLRAVGIRYLFTKELLTPYSVDDSSWVASGSCLEPSNLVLLYCCIPYLTSSSSSSSSSSPSHCSGSSTSQIYVVTSPHWVYILRPTCVLHTSYNRSKYILHTY